MNLTEFLALGIPSYETARQLALVFNVDIAEKLDKLQKANEERRHKVDPVLLKDGRYMLCADVLTEIGENGVFAEGFAMLNKELFNQVDVIAWAAAVQFVAPPVPEGI